jgi:hypothetical protein
MKKCANDKVLNPKTNRCVKKDGTVGKNLLKKSRKSMSQSRSKSRKSRSQSRSKSRKSRSRSRSKSRKNIQCKDNKIINPETNRCVKKDGIIGKKIIGKRPSTPNLPYLGKDIIKNIRNMAADPYDLMYNEIKKMSNSFNEDFKTVEMKVLSEEVSSRFYVKINHLEVPKVPKGCSQTNIIIYIKDKNIDINKYINFFKKEKYHIIEENKHHLYNYYEYYEDMDDDDRYRFFSKPYHTLLCFKQISKIYINIQLKFQFYNPIFIDENYPQYDDDDQDYHRFYRYDMDDFYEDN